MLRLCFLAMLCSCPFGTAIAFVFPFAEENLRPGGAQLAARSITDLLLPGQSAPVCHDALSIPPITGQCRRSVDAVARIPLSSSVRHDAMQCACYAALLLRAIQ